MGDQPYERGQVSRGIREVHFMLKREDIGHVNLGWVGEMLIARSYVPTTLARGMLIQQIAQDSEPIRKAVKLKVYDQPLRWGQRRSTMLVEDVVTLNHQASLAGNGLGDEVVITQGSV